MLLYRCIVIFLLFSYSTGYILSKMGLKSVQNQQAAEMATTSTVTDFDRLVYDACSRVPKGMVTTYKEIAKEIGRAGAYRAVGSSLRRNPFAPKVPCHRVVASDLSLGGFYGSKDPRGDLLLKKRAMLQAEGVVFDAGNRKRKICDSADNDISGDTSRVNIGGQKAAPKKAASVVKKAAPKMAASVVKKAAAPKAVSKPVTTTVRKTTTVTTTTVKKK